ncbi:S-adenosyl-L-methionine-dependent methyltransferase [Xylariaceae sp. FL0594]|nr:S-adenosyl-L-methionine-dependent methyltransferase [Xylariaceae sp. FL0594]
MLLVAFVLQPTLAHLDSIHPRSLALILFFLLLLLLLFSFYHPTPFYLFLFLEKEKNNPHQQKEEEKKWQHTIEAYDQAKFWLGRKKTEAAAAAFRSSACLHLQHYLVQNTIGGYLLEPSIEEALLSPSSPSSPSPSSSVQLKVADLGCGNGVWLTELHSYLFSKYGGDSDVVQWQLDGYDITSGNFPHSAYLPSSVTLHERDILQKKDKKSEDEDEEDDGTMGAYDVVHIRAFGSLVRTEAALPLILGNACWMLKPGGFLQWEEMRGDRFIVESPPSPSSSVNCKQITDILTMGLRAKGIDSSWVDALPTHFTRSGLDNVKGNAYEMRRQDYKAWTEDLLFVFDEIADLFPSEETNAAAPVTRERWA